MKYFSETPEASLTKRRTKQHWIFKIIQMKDYTPLHDLKKKTEKKVFKNIFLSLKHQNFWIVVFSKHNTLKCIQTLRQLCASVVWGPIRFIS